MKIIIVFVIAMILASFICSAANFATTDIDTLPVSQSATNTAASSAASQKEYSATVTDEKDIGTNIGLETGKIKVKGIKVEKPAGKSTTLSFIDKNSYVELIDSKGNWRRFFGLDKLKVKVNGAEKEYAPKIVVDGNGQIEEAYFTSTEGGKYAFGDSEVDVPKGGGVIYQKNKGKGELQLSVPANTKITAPKIFDDKSNVKLAKVSYISWDNSFLELENGMKIQGASVHYIDGKLAFSGKNINFNGLVIRDASAEKISYLDFTGKNLDVPGPYISMNLNEKIIFIGTNTNQDSHSLMFQKGNLYGLTFDADTDHMAVRVLGDEKTKSYFSITDKDRTDKGFVPLGKIVGNVAVNVDDGGVGTYLKNNEIYKSQVGRVISDFSDIPGKTTIPVELSFYKLNQKGEEVPVSLKRVIINGKESVAEERVVLSNRNELGIGANPTWIAGSLYSRNYPVLTRGVSNRVAYNYVQFTPEGVSKFTGVRIIPDSYSRNVLKQDDYRMLLDWLNSLSPFARKRVGEIYLHERATMGGYEALAWGGPGGIEIGVGSGAFTPGIITHEATHAVNIDNNNFWSAWTSVGGKSDSEDPSEFAEYAFKDIRGNLQSSKSFRGKMAVLVQQGVISQYVFDQQLLRAGLETGTQATERYIREARGS
ncbi:MAG: hypothetical protein AABX54_00715 [Nanoarchaeota archaeon]